MNFHQTQQHFLKIGFSILLHREVEKKRLGKNGKMQKNEAFNCSHCPLKRNLKIYD